MIANSTLLILLYFEYKNEYYSIIVGGLGFYLIERVEHNKMYCVAEHLALPQFAVHALEHGNACTKSDFDAYKTQTLDFLQQTPAINRKIILDTQTNE